MQNRTINYEIIKMVGEGLQELRYKFVFVGGAIISVYADDPAAEEARPTDDIDLAIHIATYGKWSALQEELAILGFEPDKEKGIICRYTYKGITVDIMPDNDIGIGPANSWFKTGFENLIEYNFAPGFNINIFTVGVYLATKFEAFQNRGSDPRTSHDFEDIIFVMDNNLDLVGSIRESEPLLREYLKKSMDMILKNPYRDEIISVHLSAFSATNRLNLIIEKMETIVKLPT